MKKTIGIVLIFFNCYFISAQDVNYSFSLSEAVNYAMTHNYTVRNAVLDIEAAENLKKETTAFGLPQIEGTVDYQNFLKQVVTLIPSEFIGQPPGDFVEVIFGTKQNLNATVTLRQLLFDGSYLVGLQSAKTFLKISNLAKEKTDQSIREAVINAYGNVLIAQETILILEKNKLSLEKNLNDTKAFLKNGFAEEQDVEQQQITLSNTNNDLNRAVRFELIANQMFNLTMGIPIATNVKLEDNLEMLTLKSTDLNIISQTFNLDSHIDFKIADNKVISDELLVKFEKSKYLPSLNAFINYSQFANNDNQIFYSGNWFDSSLFGVSLNVPIFSGFQRSSRTQQAKISLLQSEIELTETSEKLKLQVTTAKNKYQFALDQFQTAKQNLVLAESISNKEEIKFFEGISTSIDLTNAQNQLFNQQQNYIQSIFEIIQTKVELENALNIY